MIGADLSYDLVKAGLEMALVNLAARTVVDRERILNAVQDGATISVVDFPGALSLRVDGLQVALLLKVDMN